MESRIIIDMYFNMKSHDYIGHMTIYGRSHDLIYVVLYMKSHDHVKTMSMTKCDHIFKVT